MNWRNTAENLLIVLISVAFGTYVGNELAIKTAQKMLEEQKSIIELAIKKETTSITNEVKTEIKKIKSRKSAPIQVVIDPNITSQIKQKTKQNTKQEPSIAVANDSTKIYTKPKKKGFLKRIFKRRNKRKK